MDFSSPKMRFLVVDLICWVVMNFALDFKRAHANQSVKKKVIFQT